MTTKVLVLKSSINGEAGKSNVLVETFLEGYLKKASCTVTTRDLAASPLPHLSGAEFASWLVAADERTEEQKKLAELSDKLVAEFKDADVVVVGVPMYNFHVPSNFKAYVDRLARAGVTFKYTATGPAPLLESKKVYFLCARGGVYQGTPNDTQTPWLKAIFGLIGQTDLEFVYAEGLATANAEKGLEAAKEAIAAIVEKL